MNTKGSRLKKLLPGLSEKKITSIVQEIARRECWSEDLMWTGLHNLRHGREAQVYRMAMGLVQAAGSWSSVKAAQGYAELARICPIPPERK